MHYLIIYLIPRHHKFTNILSGIKERKHQCDDCKLHPNFRNVKMQMEESNAIAPENICIKRLHVPTIQILLLSCNQQNKNPTILQSQLLWETLTIIALLLTSLILKVQNIIPEGWEVFLLTYTPTIPVMNFPHPLWNKPGQDTFWETLK